MQPNSFIGSLTLLFSRALVYSTFILLVCSFISHLSPPRVRCVHNYALQVVLVLQPHAALGFEAHVHGLTSPLPAHPCCLPSSSRVQRNLCAVIGSCYTCLPPSLCMLAGRSPTPLIDLERYQIEMLVDMGISDVELYRVALTAPSAVSPDQIVASSFDRLEFLGDSVVGLVFRSWVYNRLASHLTCSFHKWSSSFPAGPSGSYALPCLCSFVVATQYQF